MKDTLVTVLSNKKISDSTNIVSFSMPPVGFSFLPGQFFEIQVSKYTVPFLRRPYSIHWVTEKSFDLMNKVVGKGSKILYNAKKNEKFRIIAPLGNSFGYNDHFELAFIVSGGIGVAPMAFLQAMLKKHNKKFINLVGGRTKTDIVLTHLENTYVSTDDGSQGFKGNIIELFEKKISDYLSRKIKVFACGPNKMLGKLSKVCSVKKISCEVSIESVMGCGIGICYGCPIKTKSPEASPKLQLLCKHGSVFNAEKVVFE